MPELTASLGARYLAETKLDRGYLEKKRPLIRRGEALKHYPQAETIPLPREAVPSGPGFWQVLQTRRTERRYGSGFLSRRELALLLWASQGVTDQAGSYLLRTAPSAGALYPIETYVAAEKMEDLPRGIYHLDVRRFQLERLTASPPGRDIVHAALEQSFLREAAAIVLWSGVFRRTLSKYGNRGLRYVFLDAGHICQNLLLAAEALALAACPIAAFYDDELNDLLGLNGEEESVLYLAAVGRKAGPE